MTWVNTQLFEAEDLLPDRIIFFSGRAHFPSLNEHNDYLVDVESCSNINYW